MNKKEFAVLADCIKSYFPREKVMPTKESMTLWYEALKDLDFNMAMMAVKKHSLTSKWSPTIAEIRESAVSIAEPEKSWSEGWEQVRLAIGRYGYCNEKDALESMDAVTREAAKRLGWQTICTTELDDIHVLRANFRMIYEQIQESHEADAILPSDMKEQIDTARAEEVKRLTDDLADKLGF